MSSALILVFILAAFLRFNNLDWNPGWFSDEGSDVNIAHNLMNGEFQYFAIRGTPLVAARVPLFHILLIGAFSIWGYGLTAARYVVAISSLATIILFYWTTRRMMGRGLALLAAFILTIMPNAVQYNRMAYAYNVQALLMVLCWLALWEYSVTPSPGWLLVAVAMAGISSMITLTGLTLILLVALVVFWYRPRDLFWSLPLMLAPAALYVGVLFYAAPVALQQDLTLTFTRSSASLLGQFVNLASNYTLWFDWTPWIVLGVAGLFSIEPLRVRLLTLIFFFGALFNVMRVFPGGFELSYHHYLGFLPFLALGAAQFLSRAYRVLFSQFHAAFATLAHPCFPQFVLPALARRALSGTAVFLILVTPLIWLTAWDYYLTTNAVLPRPTRIDSALAKDPRDAIAVTDFINQRLRPGEVVLASPTIAWRIQGNVSDFQQALAYEGISTDNYGDGVSRDRFVFDPSFENATFVIVDNLWRGWASDTMPALKGYMAQAETWPCVMHRGEYDVYRNPAR